MIGIIQVMFDLGMNVFDFNKPPAVRKCRKKPLSKLIAIKHFCLKISENFSFKIFQTIFFYSIF
jgi:hypothetical protein